MARLIILLECLTYSIRVTQVRKAEWDDVLGSFTPTNKTPKLRFGHQQNNTNIRAALAVRQDVTNIPEAGVLSRYLLARTDASELQSPPTDSTYDATTAVTTGRVMFPVLNHFL